MKTIDTDKLQSLWRKFSGYKDGNVYQKDGCLYFETKDHSCPHTYVYDMDASKDIYGRPSRWYPLYRWLDECSVGEVEWSMPKDIDDPFEEDI